MESLYKIKGRGLPNLSEQDLVDCSRAYGNLGCSGGWYHWAWEYIKAKGIAATSVYPYTAKNGVCKTVSRPNKVLGYSRILATDAAIMAAVNIAPVAVAVDANYWPYYRSGIFSYGSTYVNHAVVIVGYVSGSHWIIRNSWGTSWGEQGYMRLLMGYNTCGVRGYAMSLSV